jgi:NTP pyrophosphatase (non-canonical NTP hydrolase)
MGDTAYELVEPVEGFSEGEILDVTARFGDWHLYDVKLRPRSESGSVEMTVEELGEVAEAVNASA